MNVIKANAFTESTNAGNPAGVALNAPNLTEQQMKNITQILKVSETAFVYPSRNANFRLRFFSPTIEVDLCGHATIATFFTMGIKKILHKKTGKITVTQETKAGILPVNLYFKNNHIEKVMMRQGPPVIKNIQFSSESLAQALRIDKTEIDTTLPQQLVSTGLFTLPLGIKSLDCLKHVNPDFNQISQFCTKIGAGSIHLFSLETIENQSTYHARNFAPLYGINEDPVTGTANGALGWYLLKNKILSKNQMIGEQGDIIGRPGRVFIEIDDIGVQVGGKATIVEEREIDME